MNPILTYKEAATQALLEAMEADPRVILMGEGVDGITGVYGHVLPAFRKFGASRVIDTPLSENALTGFAIGAALDGLRPVLIHQRNDFMLLTMDQLMNQAAKIRYASGGHHRMPLTILSFVARKPGEGAQHSQSLQAVFAHFPGITVGMPVCSADAKGMLLAAIESDDPAIILEHRSLFDEKGPVDAGHFVTPYEARRYGPMGRDADITVVSASVGVRDSLAAAVEIRPIGIEADVIDLRWVRPLDVETVVDSVRKTHRLLAVDTGWKMFGVASEVVASVAEHFTDWKCPPRRIALPDIPCPASQFLESQYHPSAKQIAATICEMVKPFEL